MPTVCCSGGTDNPFRNATGTSSTDQSLGNPADERVILFCHCEIHVAGVGNVEVRPAINTDIDHNPNPNPNRIPNRKLSLLEMAENNITRSSAGLPKCVPFFHAKST